MCYPDSGVEGNGTGSGKNHFSSAVCLARANFLRRTALKKTTGLALLSFALLLGGCHKPVSLDEPDYEKKETPGRDLDDRNPTEFVTVQFSTRLAPVATRTTPSEDALLKSNKLVSAKDIRILFYSLDDQSKPDVVQFAFERKFEIFRGKATGADLLDFSFETRTLKLSGRETLPVGNYAVVYFTSPSKGLREATEKGKPFSALTHAIQLDTFQDQGLLWHSIFSNVEEPTLITEEMMRKKGLSGPLEVNAPHLKALNGLVYVTADAICTDKRYVIPTGRHFYLWLNAANRTLIPLPKKEPVTLSDQSVYQLPIDDNYDTSNLSEAALERHFTGVDEVTKNRLNYYTFTTTTVRDERTNWAAAVPENTVSPRSVSSRTTTQLVLAVPIYPVELVKSLPKEEQESISSSWVSLPSGKTYFINDFIKTYNGLRGKMLGDQEEKDNKEIIAFGRALTAQSRGVAVEELPDDVAVESPKYCFSCAEGVFHHLGLCYFSIPLRHFSDAQQPNPALAGRYGVVRNTLYNVHVKSFSGVGSPTVDSLKTPIRYFDRETEVPFLPPLFSLPDVISIDLTL